MAEEKFCWRNCRDDYQTLYCNIFISPWNFFFRKLPKISQDRWKNNRKERVKLLLLLKTIAKQKCFGSPARQRDLLVYNHAKYNLVFPNLCAMCLYVLCAYLQESL